MKAPRGTRDIGPDEMARRRTVEGMLRDVFRSYGYREVQTPTFESLGLFTAKSGPGIIDELYAFKDKSDRELALRPELTAPVMRFYFDTLKMEPKPLRLYYVGNCFRYDRPQAGRYREFWQMGCELIGDASPASLAELLAMATRLVEAAGLETYGLRVGHLGVLRAALEGAGVPRSEQAPVMRLIDKRDMAALKRTVPEAAFARLEALFGAKDVDAVAAVAGSEAAGACRELAEVIAHGKALGLDPGRMRVDAGIARGLDYYTGLVFELDAPRLGAEKQLLGGGEYDLADVFGEQPVATVGFALGFDRLVLAVEADGRWSPVLDRPDVHAGAMDAAALPTLLRAATILRRAGARVEVDPQPRAPGKALARADQAKAKYAMIAGPKEHANGAVALKDLASGEQTTVALASLAEEWTRRSAAGAPRPTTRPQG